MRQPERKTIRMIKTARLVILAGAVFLSGCGRNKNSEESSGAVPEATPPAVSAAQPAELSLSSNVEVIVFGEEMVTEPVVATPLENLLAATENCDSVADLLKALQNSPHKEEDLAALCREADGNLSVLAAQALVRLGSAKATLELISLVSDLPDGRFKTDVLFEAEQLNAPESVPVLLEALRVAADYDVQRLCQQALANIADSDLISRIQYTYAQTEDEDRRSALAETLRYVENEEAVPVLIGVMNGTGSLSDPLALAATDALGTLGSEEAVRALFQRLETAENRDDAEIIVRSIRRIANEDALDILQRMAQSGGDGELSTGSAARKALLNFPK